MTPFDQMLATIAAAQQLLLDAASQYKAIRDEPAQWRSPEMDRLDECIENVLHECESHIGLSLNEITRLRRRVELQRAYSCFSLEIFTRIVTEGWSTPLVKAVYDVVKDQQDWSLKHLSDTIKDLHTDWHAAD